MKVAVHSSSFAGPLRRGEITHLEWLAGCSARLDADGVVLALDDLPRTDLEYAAQVKKVATDLGIVPVALDVPAGLDPDRPEAERAAALELATALGVALVRTGSGPPGQLPPQSFARTVLVAKAWAKAAKAVNVTLLVQPAPGTLIADAADARHLVRDVDSAWLRYALDAAAPDQEELGPRDRVLLRRQPLDGAAPPDGRGWVVVEGDAGDDPFTRLGAVVTALRAASAAH